MTTTRSGALRLESIFSDLRAHGRKALMPFIVGGHPTIECMPDLLCALDANGASAIEVGIPFSDPIADGPVIASAMHDAIECGVTPAKVLDAIARARPRLSCAIIAMVSVSIVQRLGTHKFIALARDAGVDGFIFPDAPLEEADELSAAAAAAGLSSSLLIAPTTPPDRAARIAQACTGFVYMLARRGITGATGAAQHTNLAQRIAHIRSATPLPIACGFGIATAADVRNVVHAAGADAAIVGTALVDALRDTASPISAAETLMRQLSAGLHP
ncbi:MAG: tryptophan synthase subunit alpha [Phycisphaerales bacterium]|nr:tryptophan synthase subunit alpha [Phycisphaerales bacterium]